ncbi:hypothetical protein NADFUDRAFT_45496 [Nadsonia fulvescens var. elongata DSM 6958]|uniref:MARVEL domain-containing protein n=1 Tax=Nadsonia fulvescens var. elongata DSM 6958 TaxID=857566 RepID=A0A1E3PPL8_9ASCO|nr:hypothetical protein NADFUDRAFT_45496 [Nadsonia fulvescens var. elongata DSM 6958]
MVKVILILRALQFLLSLIVLALSAATIGLTVYGYVEVDAYSVFVAAFTCISILYFVMPKWHIKKLSDSLVVMCLELLNNVFWFTNFIALAAIRGPGSCTFYGYWSYYGTVKYTSNSCKTGKASIAFAALTWCTFLITSWFVVNAHLSGAAVPETQAEGSNSSNLAESDTTPANLESGQADQTLSNANNKTDNPTMTEPEKVYISGSQ